MNMNSNESLIKLRDTVLESLSHMTPPTGVAISAQPAPGKLEDAPEEDPDVRGGGAIHDELRVKKADGYESEEEPTERVGEKEAPPRVGLSAAALMRPVEESAAHASLLGPAPMEGVVKKEPAAPSTVSGNGERGPGAPMAAVGVAVQAPEAAAALAGGPAALVGNGAVPAGVPPMASAAVGGGAAVAPAMGQLVAPISMPEQVQPFPGPAALHSIPMGQARAPDPSNTQPSGSSAPETKTWPPA